MNLVRALIPSDFILLRSDILHDAHMLYRQVILIERIPKPSFPHPFLTPEY